MCHSPCICNEWKNVNCGGNFTGDNDISSKEGANKCALHMNFIGDPASKGERQIIVPGQGPKLIEDSDSASEDSSRASSWVRMMKRVMVTSYQGATEQLDSGLQDKCVG